MGFSLSSFMNFGWSKNKTNTNNAWLQSIYDKLAPGLATQSQENPYLNTAQNYYNNVLSDKYQAISNDELSRMYNYQAGQLQDSFKAGENNLAGRLAKSGLSGSRVAAKSLSNQSNANNKALAEVSNNLQNQNLQATLANKQQAFGMAPTLASAYTANQQAYLTPWLQLGGMMSGLNNTTSRTNTQTTGVSGTYGWG